MTFRLFSRILFAYPASAYNTAIDLKKAKNQFRFILNSCSGIVYIFVVLAGCSGAAYISPSESTKPCIHNFKTEGSLLSGKKYFTEAPLASKSLNKIIDQLLARFPAIGFQIDHVDRKRGIIYALHSQTMAISRERAATLTAVINTKAAIPSVSLTFELKPAQISFEGEVQNHFCQVIAATEIESVEY